MANDQLTRGLISGRSNTAREEHRAAITTAAHAKNPADLRDLLDALGLHPTTSEKDAHA